MNRRSASKGGIILAVVVGIALEQISLFGFFHELGHLFAAIMTDVKVMDIGLTWIAIESTNWLIDISGQIAGVLFYSWFVHLAATTPRLEYRPRQIIFALFSGYLCAHALLTPVTWDFLDLLNDYPYNRPFSIAVFILATLGIWVYTLLFMNFAVNLIKQIDKKDSRHVGSGRSQEAIHGTREYQTGSNHRLPDASGRWEERSSNTVDR